MSCTAVSRGEVKLCDLYNGLSMHGQRSPNAARGQPFVACTAVSQCDGEANFRDLYNSLSMQGQGSPNAAARPTFVTCTAVSRWRGRYIPFQS